MLPEPQQILHVEDSDEDAAIIEHLLRGSSYRISRARTYGEMMAHASSVDVVLLDLRIPGSDDPLRLVRDAVRRFRGAGVILLTGISDTEGEELSVCAMAEGAQIRMLKGTFDRRRLKLAVREAYQQRQHLIRQIEESRSDMRVDPKILQSTFRDVLGKDLYRRLEALEERDDKILGKLRKLGAEDTQPLEPVQVDHRSVATVLQWFSRHQKALGWVFGLLTAGYIAVSQYVDGMRRAVFETREIVQQIKEILDEQ